jgi:hypothetical protein
MWQLSIGPAITKDVQEENEFTPEEQCPGAWATQEPGAFMVDLVGFQKPPPEPQLPLV